MQQWHEAAALHSGGYRQAGHLEQGWRKINIQRQRLHRLTALGWGQARIEDDQRDANALLIHQPLVSHAAFAGEPAVVRREEDDRVVRQPAFGQFGDDSPDFAVDAGDQPVVVTHRLLVHVGCGETPFPAAVPL